MTNAMAFYLDIRDFAVQNNWHFEDGYINKSDMPYLGQKKNYLFQCDIRIPSPKYKNKQYSLKIISFSQTDEVDAKDWKMSRLELGIMLQRNPHSPFGDSLMKVLGLTENKLSWVDFYLLQDISPTDQFGPELEQSISTMVKIADRLWSAVYLANKAIEQSLKDPLV